MDLSYSPEEQAFREDVRAFLEEELPSRISAKVKAGHRLTKDDMVTWHTILARRGWHANWLKEHGGTGWNAVERQIFEEEACAAGAPRILPFGVSMLGPVLIKYGSDAQKERFLPRILDGTDWWAQGYSEPGAGSDLASLKTRADRDGDHYVVNGQKTWTTLGQHADWIFCLVRTRQDGKPQEGISFLLIDMRSQGVTVRPIITLDGEREVNEVFFDNVRVPLENRVGEENKGWTCAKFLLTHERTGIAGIGFSMEALRRLKAIMARQTSGGRPLSPEDTLFAARVAQVEIDLEAMKTTNLRVVSAAAAGGAPGPESSMLKIKGVLIRQELNDLTRRAFGPYAIPFVSEALDEGWNEAPIGPEHANPVAMEYFNNRKMSIYGGSNEIQKNIIAKAILGL